MHMDVGEGIGNNEIRENWNRENTENGNYPKKVNSQTIK